MEKFGECEGNLLSLQIAMRTDMEDFDNKRIGEIILYILGKGELLSQYYVYKILYFAERKHLARWGCGILPGEFHAWEKGPVPKKIYGGIKHFKEGNHPIDIVLRKVIDRTDRDMGDYLIALRKPDMDFISQSEVEALDESYAENVGLTVGELMNKSHDSAWTKARAKGNDEVMPSIDMAEVEGVSSDLLEYIAESEAVRAALEKSA